MEGSEQTTTFDMAVTALNVLLERELTAGWEKTAASTCQRLMIAAAEAKRPILCECFKDAAEGIAGVVDNYFPKLLGVARAATKCLYVGGQKATPPGWTAAHIRAKVCYFLGIDEEFDNRATPRNDSRVIHAARLILYATGSLRESPSGELLLPWWADRGVLWGWQLSRLPSAFTSEGSDCGPANYPFAPASGDENACLSAADSLAWIKERETEIHNRLERQIENGMLAAMVAAGQQAKRVSQIKTKLRKPSKRQSVIFNALRYGKKGPDYCRFMDGHGISTPAEWDGCPRSYSKAYLDKNWRKRIQNEKHRALKLFRLQGRDAKKSEPEAGLCEDIQTKPTRRLLADGE